MLFSHDGIHDSQTHLAAAPYFYDQLRREISLSARTKKPLALVKILFTNPNSEQVKPKDILQFSYELKLLTRTEDCIGRMGINEVIVIIRDGSSHAEQFVQRLLMAKSLTVESSLRIHFSTVSSLEKEGLLGILERLDLAPLSTTH